MFSRWFSTRFAGWLARCLLPLAVCMALSSAAQAVRLTALYDVEVPVADQSRQSLGQAASAGLGEVVVRVVGDREALEQAPVRQALSRAESFLRQFSYRRGETPEGEPQWLARLSFDPRQVESLLRGAGLPQWAAERPAAWVWVALDEGGQRRFVPADGYPPLVDALAGEAQRRGVPLRYPLLDLDDSLAYSLDDAWRLDAWEAQAAARRYDAELVITGRIAQLGNGRWLASWVLLFDGRDYRLDAEAEDIAALAAGPIDLAADIMAEKYAIAPVAISATGLLMRVDGIGGFEDYAQLLNRVEALAPVTRAVLVAVEGDSAVLRLSADGELRQLRAALGSIRGMTAVAEGGIDPGVQLHFSWHTAE